MQAWKPRHQDALARFMAAIAPSGAAEAVQLSGLSLKAEVDLARQAGQLRYVYCMHEGTLGQSQGQESKRVSVPPTNAQGHLCCHHFDKLQHGAKEAPGSRTGLMQALPGAAAATVTQCPVALKGCLVSGNHANSARASVADGARVRGTTPTCMLSGSSSRASNCRALAPLFPYLVRIPPPLACKVYVRWLFLCERLVDTCVACQATGAQAPLADDARDRVMAPTCSKVTTCRRAVHCLAAVASGAHSRSALEAHPLWGQAPRCCSSHRAHGRFGLRSGPALQIF